MCDLFWLTDKQMERLTPFFPKSRGRARVDYRRILSGIIFVNRNGLRLARRASRLRATQDPLQSLGSLEPHGGLRPDAGGPGRGRPIRK
jgi:hypothetical protein